MKANRIYAIIFSALLVMAPASPAFSDESATGTQTGALEVNNSWEVWGVFKDRNVQNPLYVTIRQSGNHWEIEDIYNSLPRILHSQDVELFMASRDLQFWKNAYVDYVGDCDNFEVQQSDYQSTCTSRFGEKKTARAIIGVFFGGAGRVG